MIIIYIIAAILVFFLVSYLIWNLICLTTPYNWPDDDEFPIGRQPDDRAGS